MAEILTIKEVDDRIAKNDDRIIVIDDALKINMAELGKVKALKLSTESTHKTIDKLEHERRELTAEQGFLTQEHTNIQNANEQAAAKNALVEYLAGRDQMVTQGAEIVKSIYALKIRLAELEKIKYDMSDKAVIARGLVNPAMLDDVIAIDTSNILLHIDRAIYNICNVNGKESIEKIEPRIYIETLANAAPVGEV